MSRVQVSYISVCYALLIILLASSLLPCFLHPRKYWLPIAVLSTICLGLMVLAIGFRRRYRGAWYATWIVGVLAVILGGWVLWGATTGPQIRDSGEAWPIGFVIIGFALGALWNLATSEVERFVVGEKG